MRKADILDRIISFYTLKNKTGLASFLGVSPQTVSNWYSRNSVDYDLIFEKCEGVDYNWLIAGSGKSEYQFAGNNADIASDRRSIYEVPLLRSKVIPVISSGGYTISEFGGEINFLNTDTVSVPENMLGDGSDYVAFRIPDDAMAPVYSKDNYAICKRVVDLNRDTVLPNKAYLFAVSSGRLVLRRILHAPKSLKKVVLTADNPRDAGFSDMDLNIADVKALWSVRLSISLPEQHSVEQMAARISELEKTVAEILDIVG